MQRRDLTFRVFVSSTFSDLDTERNALQEYVFPRLRELCRKHGAQFQAIDLRWGVSEEASLDQQTMNICLEELQAPDPLSPLNPDMDGLIEYWGTSDPAVISPRELELERIEHQRFGQERAPANSFVGREHRTRFAPLVCYA